MDRGKRVMQPEADFDLNMEPPSDRDEKCMMAEKDKILKVKANFDLNMEPPPDGEGERKMPKKTKISDIEAKLDHTMPTSEKEKKELKKELIQYIKENNLPIETKELEKIEDPYSLWEIIILLNGLTNMDPELSASQSIGILK